MSTIEVRRCLLCGEAYATTSNRRKYCCDCIKVVQAVRNLDYYKKNREKSKEYQRKYKKRHRKSHTYICQICGKENTAKQGVTKYCLDCLKNADNYKMQTYYQNRSSKL